jgi:uncharacterized membrane protein YfcA
VEFTVGAVVAAAVATIVGASIQGGVGFGMNLVVVPVLALVLPESLPATAVLLGVPISIVMFQHEHHALDREGIAWIVAGRIPGTIVGTIIVATVTTAALQGFIGVAVLLAVAISVFAPPIPARPSTQATIGAVSGITGTAAGIGGPPVALLYQHHPGPTMRSTLAASFFFGTLLSITALTVAGEMLLADVALAAGLLPLVVVGSWIGRQAHGILDRRWLRPAVLGFAAIAAIVVLIDAVF